MPRHKGFSKAEQKYLLGRRGWLTSAEFFSICLVGAVLFTSSAAVERMLDLVASTHPRDLQ